MHPIYIQKTLATVFFTVKHPIYSISRKRWVRSVLMHNIYIQKTLATVCLKTYFSLYLKIFFIFIFLLW